MTEEKCPNYCGLACVDGHCPNALADDYLEYGYEHCSCEECGYYRGCKDCCFDGDPECCFKAERSMK